MYHYYPDIPFETLKGLTLVSVERRTGDNEEDELVFTADDGRVFVQHHVQDCCENVSIEDIAGDLDDLVGSEILLAEVATNRRNEIEPENQWESYTWTYYKLRTMKGSVTIRWYGSSNGYYSESVQFEDRSNPPKEL